MTRTTTRTRSRLFLDPTFGEVYQLLANLELVRQ
jgi:hypothetical protein